MDKSKKNDLKIENNDSPIFVIGAPRSGTTLLRSLLDSHSNIALSPESGYLFIYHKLVPLSIYGNLNKKRNLNKLVSDLMNIRRVKQWLPGNLSCEYIADKIREENKDIQYSEIIRALFESYAYAKGKTRWGDKTPKNSLRIDKIKELFPAAKFILIVRDGRDVALSLNKAAFSRVSISSAAYEWKKYINVTSDGMGKYPSDFYKIKYEELTQDPEKCLKGILSFLNESWEEDILYKYLSHPDDVKHTKAVYYGKEIAANSGKWLTEMKTKDLCLFEKIAGRELVEEGYRLSGKSAKFYLHPVIFKYLDSCKKFFNGVYIANHINFFKIFIKRLFGV